MAVAIAMMPAIASAQTASTVTVEQVDFALKTGATSVAPGAVTFAIKNSGARPHELVVVRTDLDPKALPLKDGRVDESAVQIVARSNRLTPPDVTTGILNANLATGRYVLFCNVGTHYAQGMNASLAAGTPATPAPAPAPAAAPAPARTGTGGPLVGGADRTAPWAQFAIAAVAGLAVLVARRQVGRDR
ncbi:MAG: hypothetical protein WC273_10410 [Dehalococcoidia bacterium]